MFNGETIEQSIQRHFRPCGEPTSPLVFTEDFKAGQAHAAGITTRNALPTLSGDGRVECWEDASGGIQVVLATRYVEVGEPHTQLLFATHEVGSNQVAVSDGWRLYDLPREVTPSAAFSALLTRFGHDFSIGDRVGRFVADEIVEGTDVSLEPLNPVQGLVQPTGIVKVHGANGPTEVMWAWILDGSAYQRAAEEGRRGLRSEG